MRERAYEVVVVGGGHAGVEAAWAAANLLPRPHAVALVTMDPRTIGVMSCNPAIGGLAKGQLVREIDALGGVMGLASDATGIQFRVLNTSKGPAVRGPRAQCDKHLYARAVQRLISSRPEIDVVAGSVEGFVVERGVCVGVRARVGGSEALLRARAVVLTTGTFLRALMHTGEDRTPGGRHGEASAEGTSGALRALGFELGRLKTGTPPRLARSSLRWEDLEAQHGDERPTPFSDLTRAGGARGTALERLDGWEREGFVVGAFPLLEQVECRQTQTGESSHALIRANLHRAPMYSGQIESAGPRYCPSIEDKVVRFAERGWHGVFLEPESLGDEWVYCNGISTSLPRDVQEELVRSMPGCEGARILRYGYAVEYDMVRPHQIRATGETKLVEGLFLAGQINGTSGYEEAAAQGVVAGINAARRARGEGGYSFARSGSYVGVLMDDLVTKTPREPYRMFTSRAEHRLSLRADNAADRLTPAARELGLLDSTELGRARVEAFGRRRARLGELDAWVGRAKVDGAPLDRLVRGDAFDEHAFAELARRDGLAPRASDAELLTAFADRRYEAYVVRQRAEVRRQGELEHRRIPAGFDPRGQSGLRGEAVQALARFRPETFGQAGRLEGVTPADVTLLAVLVRRWQDSRGAESGA